jgi:hypothetical protein
MFMRPNHVCDRFRITLAKHRYKGIAAVVTDYPERNRAILAAQRKEQRL